MIWLGQVYSLSSFYEMGCKEHISVLSPHTALRHMRVTSFVLSGYILSM